MSHILLLLIIGLTTTVVNGDLQCYSCHDCPDPVLITDQQVQPCGSSIVNINSALIETNEYMCYKLTRTVHCQTVVNRGCAPKNNASVCHVKPHINSEPLECSMCYGDKCNGSTKLSLSIVLTMLFAMVTFVIQ